MLSKVYVRSHAAGPYTVVLLTSMLVATGCGDGRVAVYPARGTVRVDGQPAAGARVILHATKYEPIEGQTVPIPTATAANDGTFVLTSFDEGDGAPAGEYDVTITWPMLQDSAATDPEAQGPSIDRLRGRYADPDTSGITVTISEGDNVLEPFELKLK